MQKLKLFFDKLKCLSGIKEQFKIKNYSTMWLLIIFMLLFATPVFAAEFFFDAPTGEVPEGNQFEVNFFMNAQNDNINAVEGKIVFPEKLLKLKEIRDGDSIITFWIENPKTAGGNEIRFAGIILGGYADKKGLIFSMIFQAKNKGENTIKINGARALRNDGNGTEANAAISNYKFTVSDKSDIKKTRIQKEDAVPPEPFEPIIARDPEIFDGKYFLAFAAQDKQSGVGHYEVREGKRPFTAAGSPYLLRNQNLDEKVIVKAVDKNGNERFAVLRPRKQRTRYKNYFIFGILILAIIFFYAILKFLWKKQKQN